MGRWLVVLRIRKGFYESLEVETNDSLLRSSKDFLVAEEERLKGLEQGDNSVNKESDGGIDKGREKLSLKSKIILLFKVCGDLLFLRGGKVRNGVDYLVLAYIYCLMLDINKYYMDYKAELGHANPSSNHSELIRYRYSRSTIQKAPKALRRK